MSERTAAVVVTFNRKVLLGECLGALLRQSRPLDRIFVVDNASTDGTEQMLRDAGYLDDARIVYVRLPLNSGGAGGFHRGMKDAHAAGYDWLWLMDDDAVPLDDAFERMSAYYGGDVCAVAPAVHTPAGAYDILHRGWFRPGRFYDGFTPTPVADYARPFVDIEFGSFVGLCVHRKVVDALGLPHAELFIYCDDAEYCLRMKPLGPVRMVPAAGICHKAASGSDSLEPRWFLGKRSMRMRYDKLWSRYFMTRNEIWYGMRTHPIGWALRGLYRFVKRIPGILLFEDRKAKRIRFWFNACIDGIRGHFDNDKPRRLLDG